MGHPGADIHIWIICTGVLYNSRKNSYNWNKWWMLNFDCWFLGTDLSIWSHLSAGKSIICQAVNSGAKSSRTYPGQWKGNFSFFVLFCLSGFPIGLLILRILVTVWHHVKNICRNSWNEIKIFKSIFNLYIVLDFG